MGRCAGTERRPAAACRQGIFPARRGIAFNLDFGLHRRRTEGTSGRSRSATSQIEKIVRTRKDQRFRSVTSDSPAAPACFRAPGVDFCPDEIDMPFDQNPHAEIDGGLQIVGTNGETFRAANEPSTSDTRSLREVQKFRLDRRPARAAISRSKVPLQDSSPPISQPAPVAMPFHNHRTFP